MRSQIQREGRNFKEICLRDGGFHKNETVYLFKERERFGSFYQNKTEYLLRERELVFAIKIKGKKLSFIYLNSSSVKKIGIILFISKIKFWFSFYSIAIF